jgi:spermidine/putrescine transport system substrate-binding protein
VLLSVSLFAGLGRAQSDKKQEINLLLWGGYEQPELIDAFARKYNVKINYKTFFGGDAMYSLFVQSKGVYDVVVVDPEYVAKLHALGRLRPFDPSELDMSDYVDAMRNFPLSSIDGKMYAPVIEFGALGLLYNTKRFEKTAVESYSVLSGDKVKGRVGVWDWYLPIMGIISRSLGNQKPYDLNDLQFTALKRRMMEFRPQVRAVHATFPDMMTSLASEDTWIVPGGAGWAANILQDQGKPYDWVIPKEGRILWADTLVIPNDAPHLETAKAFVKWMMTPEAQALLSSKKAYTSNVPNMKAYDLMSEAHKKALRVVTREDINAMLSTLAVRTLPVQQTEKVWQDVWGEFKAAK